MKTFFAIKFALAPFVIFWALLSLTSPRIAISAGVLVSIGSALWRWRHTITILEAAGVGIFVALGLAYLVAPQSIGSNASALSFFGLGLVCIASVAFRRPWTADYSRAAFSEMAESPIFVAVNMAISALWGLLFLFLACVHALRGGAGVTTSMVAAGALISIFGPKLIVRFAILRRMSSRETYSWPAPKFERTGRDEEVDVAVIGAGIGGLTAAALLADAGLKVVVAEQHSAPGGFCHNFLRKTHYQGQRCIYRFDSGPHDFSGVWAGGPVDSVLRRLGVAQRLKWLPLDHTYRLGHRSIDVPSDWHEYVRVLGQLFPTEAAGLQALFADIHAIYVGMYATGKSNGGIPGLPTSVDAMLAFPRDYPLAFRWLDKPFKDLVARHVQDPEARRIVSVLSSYVSDGTDDLTCGQMVPLLGYYFHGSHYPAGGSGQLTGVLVEAIEERGGEVRLRSPVQRILVEDGRAAGLTLGDGTRISAKAVVSDADCKRSFLELVEARHIAERFRTRIATAEPANSAFMVHLGVDFIPELRPALHIIDHRKIGIEILSLVDPSAAPPGHSTIGIIALMPHAEAERWLPQPADREGAGDWGSWRHSPEYRDRKTAFGDKLIAAAETVIPDLSKHIVVRADASPVTYARYDWTSGGSIYGVSREGRLVGAKTPVVGLVLAGSATQGPGVEAAFISGALAANALVPGLLAMPEKKLRPQPHRSMPQPAPTSA